MPILQRIKRSNGSLVYSVNIPLNMIEELEWEKGNFLNLEIKRVGETSMVILCKSEEEIDQKGGK